MPGTSTPDACVTSSTSRLQTTRSARRLPPHSGNFLVPSYIAEDSSPSSCAQRLPASEDHAPVDLQDNARGSHAVGLPKAHEATMVEGSVLRTLRCRKPGNQSSMCMEESHLTTPTVEPHSARAWRAITRMGGSWASMGCSLRHCRWPHGDPRFRRNLPLRLR